MRRFAGLELADDAIPDETTIRDFRHLLERARADPAIVEAVNAFPSDEAIVRLVRCVRHGPRTDVGLVAT
jgi:transposase, IS5 family